MRTHKIITRNPEVYAAFSRLKFQDEIMIPKTNKIDFIINKINRDGVNLLVRPEGNNIRVRKMNDFRYNVYKNK